MASDPRAYATGPDVEGPDVEGPDVEGPDVEGPDVEGWPPCPGCFSSVTAAPPRRSGRIGILP
jgi:hypothetical protein